MFLYAEPMKIGVIFRDNTPVRTASSSISAEISFSSRTASVSSSENMDAVSTSSSRFSCATDKSDSGISSTRTASPLSPSKYSAFMVTKSITPSKFISRPIGSCISTAVCPSFFWSWSMTRVGFAPLLSHLLMNAIHGML